MGVCHHSVNRQKSGYLAVGLLPGAGGLSAPHPLKDMQFAGGNFRNQIQGFLTYRYLCF